jgi:translation initiation factor 2-alpha kinase 4
MIEGIRDETRLSDAEGWRRFIQGAPVAERQYLGQVQGLLGEIRARWEDGKEKDGGGGGGGEVGDGETYAGREVCLYNFRTGGCVYYDVGL